MKTRIRELRLEKNISQVTLGTRIGCSQNTISKIEKEECDPRGSLLIELAYYFGVSVDYILCLTDQRTYINCNNIYDQQKKYSSKHVMQYLKLEAKNQEVVNKVIQRFEEIETEVK